LSRRAFPFSSLLLQLNRRDTVEDIMKLFDLFSLGKTGVITLKHLKRVRFSVVLLQTSFSSSLCATASAASSRVGEAVVAVAALNSPPPLAHHADALFFTASNLRPAFCTCRFVISLSAERASPPGSIAA
jgi:hypothetical protein